MTGLTNEIARTPARRLADRRAFSLTREGGDAWAIPAFLGVTALAAFLYLWNLTVSGYANEYYSMAAQAASQSWSAWFFGSLDAANFMTVDKPPLATMLMGLSVRVLGLSSFSILLPQALLGVATVGVLFASVRRTFGTAAATIASVVMALTPAAMLIFRFDNPDALLTFFIVAGAAALLRALENGSLRWTAFAASMVGLGFLTKYMQAYLVLPAFALVWFVCANASLKKRVLGLAVAAAAVVASSGWWVAIVELLPASMKPYIGGSTTGSVMDLVLGYDGLGRIFGASAGTGGAGNGTGFGGTTGFLRLFNGQFFGQVAWFLPPAVTAFAYGMARTLRAPRIDAKRAAYLLWGSMLVVQALVFSFMSGTIHSYYVVVLAPSIGALVGAGLVDLWGLKLPETATRQEVWIGGIATGGVLLGTAAWGATLLGWTSGYMTWVGPVSIAVAAAAAGVLVIASMPKIRVAMRRVALATAAVALAASLAGPAAYAATTMSSGYSGGDPHPGPGATSGVNGLGGTRGAIDGGSTADGTMGTPPSDGAAPGATSDDGGFGGGTMGGSTASTTLIDYLLANRGSATWIVAVSSANSAAPIQLAAGAPVMAMGGFTGSDNAPTLDQLKAYVASGQLRYIIVGGQGGGGMGSTGTSSVSSWVTSTCTAVDSTLAGTSNLYDCQGAA